MNNPQQTIRVGLFFVLGLALAWITFDSLNGGQLFKPAGYTLIAPFKTLKRLKVGDDVLMAGVKIGSVARTQLGNQRVEAVLSIQPNIEIPNDAVASVEVSSLLGSNYLGVTFGTKGAPPLKNGDEIKTMNSIDINEVISQLGSLGTKLEQVVGAFGKSFGGGPDGKSGLLQRLDQLVTDNGPKLTESISNLQSITSKINQGEGTLGRLVNDPKLHDELLDSVNEIKAAATDARTFMADTKGIVADVKSGKGALGVLLYDEPTAASLRASVTNLKEVSEKLNSGKGTLGRLISDDSLYLSVQSTMKKADRALEGMGDQGPITAVGVVANSLF